MSASYQRPCPPLSLSGGTARDPPSLPSPCRYLSGCFWEQGTGADPWLSVSSAVAAEMLFLAASDKSNIFGDSLVRRNKRSRNPSCSHNTRAKDEKISTQLSQNVSPRPCAKPHNLLLPFHRWLWQTSALGFKSRKLPHQIALRLCQGGARQQGKGKLNKTEQRGFRELGQ